MSIVAVLTHLAAPWARVYADSKTLSTTVTFAHLGGLFLAGGYAIAADRSTLRLRQAEPALRRAHLEELHQIHRPVLLGLGVTFASGLLLLAADIETLLPAPLFWLKMLVVAALLANGALLQRSETALRKGCEDEGRRWRRLHHTARVSVCLWFGSLLLGTALLAL